MSFHAPTALLPCLEHLTTITTRVHNSLRLRAALWRERVLMTDSPSTLALPPFGVRLLDMVRDNSCIQPTELLPCLVNSWPWQINLVINTATHFRREMVMATYLHLEINMGTLFRPKMNTATLSLPAKSQWQTIFPHRAVSHITRRVAPLGRTLPTGHSTQEVPWVLLPLATEDEVDMLARREGEGVTVHRGAALVQVAHVEDMALVEEVCRIEVAEGVVVHKA